MRAWRSLLPLLGVVFGATPATAHIGGAEGVLPFLEGGVLVGGGTTWGVIGESGGAFAQTCEEAIGDIPRDFARIVDGDIEQIVAATSLGVMVTTDGGCSWRPAPGTTDRSIAALTTSSRPARLWGVTDDLDDAVATDNALLRSDDGGATFAAARTFPGQRLTSLAVGPDGDDELLLLAGTDVDSRRPRLFGGHDGDIGELTGPPLDDAQLARALAVDDDAVWFSTLDGIGRGHLFIAPHRDGRVGMTEAVEVGAFDGLVKATASVGGVRFATAAGSVLFSTADIGAAIEPGSWQRSTEGPLECLRRVDGDDGLWGCGRQSSGTWFKRTVDGITWTAVLPFDTVSDRQCPATTPGSEACAYRFAPPVEDRDDEPAPADDADATGDDGPSCQQADMAWPAALLLLPGRRRRR